MNKHSIISDYVIKQKLNDDEVASVKKLEEVNNREKNIFYKIDPQGLVADNTWSKHILAYQNADLRSYVYTNSFDGEVLECTILSSGTQEDLNVLYEIILQNAKQIGVNKILLITDKNDSNFINFAKKLGFLHVFSEHRMFFDNNEFKFINKGIISLHDASTDDIGFILELDGVFASNGVEPVKIDEADLLATKIAKQGDKYVGKVRIDKVGEIVGIYGFVVSSKLRGNGYGREILTSTVNECLDEGYKEIFLEVESENLPALHLYESVGFKIRATFDYYEGSIS